MYIEVMHFLTENFLQFSIVRHSQLKPVLWYVHAVDSHAYIYMYM